MMTYKYDIQCALATFLLDFHYKSSSSIIISSGTTRFLAENRPFNHQLKNQIEIDSKRTQSLDSLVDHDHVLRDFYLSQFTKAAAELDRVVVIESGLREVKIPVYLR
jgi:predicted metallo-beta-lactamase superfamily hydrolase